MDLRPISGSFGLEAEHCEAWVKIGRTGVACEGAGLGNFDARNQAGSGAEVSGTRPVLK